MRIGACRGLIRTVCGVGFAGLGGLHERQQGAYLLIPAPGGLHAGRQRFQLGEQPGLVPVDAQLAARLVELPRLRDEGAQGLKFGAAQREVGAVAQQDAVRPAVERLKNLGEGHGPVIHLHSDAQPEPVARIALGDGYLDERVGGFHELGRGAVETHLNGGNAAQLRQHDAQQLAGFPALDAALF